MGGRRRLLDGRLPSEHDGWISTPPSSRASLNPTLIRNGEVSRFFLVYLMSQSVFID